MKKTRWNLLVIVMLVLMPAIVWAQNLPPIADAGEDQDTLVGEGITLQGSAWDPNGNVISGWLWTIESKPDGSSPSLSDPAVPTPRFFPYTVGDYVLSLIASDGIEWSAPDYVTIHVTEILPPVAVADADVTSGPAPLTVTLDGSQSYDPQGGSLEYTWDFGDDSPPFYGVSTAHVYESPGVYYPQLIVVDELGQLVWDAIQITVTAATNTAPTVSPTATPNSGVAPLPVQFAANGADADGDALTYAWDFGDGYTANVADPVNTYLTSGTYEAWVTVSDGTDEASASLTIVVDPALTLNVASAKVRRKGGKSTLGSVDVSADFEGASLAVDDVISVSFDGIVLFEAPFSNFVLSAADRQEDSGDINPGLYKLKDQRLRVMLDLTANTITIDCNGVNLADLDITNGVDVELSMGTDVAVENITLVEANGRRLIYDAAGN